MTDNFGRERGVRPEWMTIVDAAQLRLPPETPPLTRFEGHLKRFSLDRLDQRMLGFLFAAFPGFMNSVVDPPLSALAVHSLEKFDLSRCDYVRRRRRYSGPGLPGGRYYSVSHDGLGDDGGTLLMELSAYADPVSGGVVFDAVDGSGGIGFRGQPVKPEQAVTLRMLIPTGPCRKANPQILKAWMKFFRQPTVPSENMTILVTLPYSVERRTIESVLDLREVQAQDWLLKAFAVADHDLLVKEGRATIGSFHELLPALISGDLGGNCITDAIGSYLRWIGAGGLVFPSARRDSFVSYADLEVVDFIGWNFVDYAGAALTKPQVYRDLSSGWGCETPSSCSLEIIETGPARRSWHLRGTSEHSAGVFQRKMRAFLATTDVDPPLQ